MNVMCTQLSHTKPHVIPRGCEELFDVEEERSLIKGSRIKFLRTLVEDVQASFHDFEWVRGVLVESWAEASSCSCERVFSYMTAMTYG